MAAVETVTNIAAYRFASWQELALKPLRERLLTQCRAWGLRGTILLSTEGINLFVAGGAAEIELLLGELRALPGMAELAPKYSLSEDQPFTRMLVRIKKEIIAFGVEGIDPAARTSPKLAPAELKRWLDEGRPVTLLDTRNDYEVRLGTFRGARTLPITHFREFPAAVRENLDPAAQPAPIVMFCTGGIRCEKAGPFMEREGFENIYQLDGGILKYFEECGGAHYDGECFVFDQRVGVDAGLRETEAAVCYACQSPLTPEEQQDPRYVPGRACPYCHRESSETMAATIARRQEALARVTTPLPGSTPRDNLRPIKIPASAGGGSILNALGLVFPHVPEGEWRELLATGQILGPGPAETAQPVPAEHIVSAGDWYFRLTRDEVEPTVNVDIRILHEDEALIVLHKPAPLPMHPSGRFNRNTLQQILHAAYAPEKPHPAHRLDANTTGLLLCARTRHFARLLQPQFARGSVEKTYLARVQGLPDWDTLLCDAPMTDAPGPAGTRTLAAGEDATLSARTEFRVISRDPASGTALVEARPLTGRTNQIRVHLWGLGLPICGDPAYLPQGRLGTSQTLAPGDPPLCLHAWRLAFEHPVNRQRLEFTAPPPEWAGSHAPLPLQFA